jgi:hypothetical protein
MKKSVLTFYLSMVPTIKSRILKSLVWIAIILTSMFIAIVLHPQEFLPSILIQIREMIFSNVN